MRWPRRLGPQLKHENDKKKSRRKIAHIDAESEWRFRRLFSLTCFALHPTSNLPRVRAPPRTGKSLQHFYIICLDLSVV